MLIDLDGTKVRHTDIRSIEVRHPDRGMTGPFDWMVVVVFTSGSNRRWSGLSRDAAEKFVNKVRAEIRQAERS